jgi:hypothetical protein
MNLLVHELMQDGTITEELVFLVQPICKEHNFIT